ncbi:PREDICTED: uncharacterized protein LOC109174395 [Ipomoea nil]|uniref:uncharacterized protein LOC109174395 n=1 Tax=Ipomoea nil TaxID=35883 RepID=UPI00090086DB|nr:PREDICTED: uncharacterized protein LOC109174395 [Ipomoea nil]
MPIPQENNIGLTENMLISEELAYDKELLNAEHETLRTLSSKIRSRGDIVLNVASSGITSLLLPGGRTTHSRFAVPLSVNEDSTCNILQGIGLCKLIIKCKLIIWDEAPMTHKYSFEALDKTMRGILRFTVPSSDQKIFGGKKVVLGDDFRQILPVIPKATRPMVVGATINSSYLWRNCKVLRLTKNLRLQSLASNEDRQTVDWLSTWIADIVDEITGLVNNGLFEIDIPPRFMLKCGPNPIATIVESIFPAAKYGMLEELHLEGRAILSPTLDVDQINQYMCDMNTVEGRTYLSCYSLCKAESDGDNLSQVIVRDQKRNSVEKEGVSSFHPILNSDAEAKLKNGVHCLEV